MFCTNCGSKLEEGAIFCTNCGTQVVKQELATPVHEPVLPVVKKSKGKVLIIIGASVALLLVAGITGYFIYQNHITKQADNLITYLDNEDYDEAIALYEKYSHKKVDFNDKISSKLIEIAEEIREKYVSEEINYVQAMDQLEILKGYKISSIDEKSREIAQHIDLINTSRENFQEGKTLYELGDYESAIEKFQLVLEEDGIYYEMAISEIDRIEEEIILRQEIELLEEMKNQALIEAANYALDYNYKQAINIIEQVLTELPHDDDLTEKLTTYRNLYEMTIKVPKITSLKEEYSYTEQDIDVMTVNMEMPVLEGNHPIYDIINEQLMTLKNQYIGINDQYAMDAILSVNDEFFHPYSFDLTYTVGYNNNGILCFILDGYIYTGGAHGNPIRDVFTFDLTTGLLIGLSDLISTDEITFSSYVTEEFQKMYEESPEEYWDDAPVEVQINSLDFNSMNYYLTENSICIFYYPYELASYVRGFVDIIIPYSGNEWMFRFLQ